ncbi:MAG: Flp family type IVb pilin [Anaerolineae bacterium]
MNYTTRLKLDGQSLVEYSIILAIVSLAIIGFLIAYGEELVNLYRLITDVW